MFKVGDEVHCGFVGKITAQELTKFNLGSCEKIVSRVHFTYPDGSSITAYVTDESLSAPLKSIKEAQSTPLTKGEVKC